MPRCKNCKEKFTARTFLQKFCMEKDECIKVFRNEIKATKWKVEKAVLKFGLITADKYRSTELQKTINKIARFIDYGCSCIATDNYGKMAGGHNISVGANRTTALNLHNIHVQSFASNSHKGGDTIKYHKGIIKRYGKDYLDFMDYLHQTPKLSLTKDEMVLINGIAKKISLELSKNLQHLEPNERIQLRNKINTELNIYSKEFCIFKL
jgi:hypothetical protein